MFQGNSYWPMGLSTQQFWALLERQKSETQQEARMPSALEGAEYCNKDPFLRGLCSVIKINFPWYTLVLVLNTSKVSAGTHKQNLRLSWNPEHNAPQWHRKLLPSPHFSREELLLCYCVGLTKRPSRLNRTALAYQSRDCLCVLHEIAHSLPCTEKSVWRA